MTTIDLIRILCVKLGGRDLCPPWRFIKKHRLSKQIDTLFNDFFSRNSFDQADGLASILLCLYSEYSKVIDAVMMSNLHMTSVSLEMAFDKLTDDINHNGKVSYIPSKGTFLIDMDANSNESDGYSFSYEKNSALSKKLQALWVFEVVPAVEFRFYEIILDLAEILNYTDYYRNIEFVND